MSAATATSQQSVRSAYRTLVRLIQQLPQKGHREKAQTELRTNFRRPIGDTETVEERLKKANDRIGFLRITTPKDRREKRAGVFVVKDGKIVEEEQAGVTTRDANGRVVSNWSGKNLDPDLVKRHNVGLKRAGFVNNTHAKGVF